MKKIILLLIFAILILFTISNLNLNAFTPDEDCTYEEIVCDEDSCTKYIYYCDGRIKQIIPNWD